MLPSKINRKAKLSSRFGTKVALRIFSQGSSTNNAVNRYTKAIADSALRYLA